MKLNVDFSSLLANAQRMGSEPVEFSVKDIWKAEEFEVDVDLDTGIDIKAHELGVNDSGLLEYKGSQVVLYIPDHSFKADDALAMGGAGNRYHVADCKTLDTMKQRKRFDRYRVTNNLTGSFDIFGISKLTNNDVSGKTELNVCKNCLSMLNYKGAKNTGGAGRTAIVNVFSLEEFFSTYSSFFSKLPKQLAEKALRGYSKDWADISARTRKIANYICRSCTVDLSASKGLLHVHHENGDKSDNSGSNLLVLCADCHRKEPFHGHMYVSHKDSHKIQQARMQQGIDINSSWAAVNKNADPALFGVLNHCQKKGMVPPDLACLIKGAQHSVMLDIAWPRLKRGVYVGTKPHLPDWDLLSPREALEYFGN